MTNETNSQIVDSIYLQSLELGAIIINEPITTDIIEKALVPLKWFLDSEEIEDPIEIIINTPGGDGHSGMALVDVIESADKPIILSCNGMAASMGLFLLMSGRNNENVLRVCNKSAVGLLHSGIGVYEGEISKMEDYSKFMSRYWDEVLVEHILRNTNFSRSQIEDMYRKDVWMTANDMLKYGIVDMIV